MTKPDKSKSLQRIKSIKKPQLIDKINLSLNEELQVIQNLAIVIFTIEDLK